MPVYPITWLPPARGLTYPHMSKHDSRIWERFLDAFSGTFDLVAYDIALGGQEPTDPTATDAERAMWRYATALKIDAAARNRDEVWLCEVRPGAGLAALGSVLGYAILSDIDTWTHQPLVMTIITDQMQPDVKTICQRLDIQVIELPEPPDAGF